ncbi:MAG: Folate-dependent protein for Fe/S cluster synthesis/repair in oxidative stress [uncultured Thiotrichaceae bacterium]|uniref:Folate-dependent protein for Fe/S cluster synthesis/repair in oxidative stress n=1 Tax=uncultured Thiotrichaceae bacterium TaxID=298394 RepID=A0A6S6SLQ4_9GAMM|nr:MAG: Folate-dependent protein for Fe/S cluster synthesis/repair in oxidative stress [uncultured Thiotrichaceae bacterium]
MKPDWKQFLVDRGAEFDANTLLHFGNPERERRIPPQGAILCDLSHIGVISASGSDTETFLQGQLSNDLQQVSDTQAQLSSYSSPKGRAISTFQIALRQGTYYLSLSNDILEPVLKRLRMFVMRSQVSLENATDSLVHFGYSDPGGEERLADIIGTIPMKPMDVIQSNGLTIIRQPAPVPRFEIFGELDAAKTIWTALGVNAAGVGRGAWDYYDVEAGIPHVTAANTEAWVPQMMNLHLTNAISFSKGCFPGQEVVARLKYLGKNKRMTYRLAIDSVEQPAIGTVVKNAGGTEAGKVLNTALNPDGKVEVLAVMKTAEVANELTLDGYAVTVLDLPYSLETD